MEEDFIIIFVKTAIRSLIYTILWIPVYAIRCLLVKLVQATQPSYGKIFGYMDAFGEEPYTESPPKNTLVFTFIFNGSFELKEIRSIFSRNVLEAKIHNKKTGEDELRYPEYKQYQTDFAGFRFWKNDPKFSLDDHITEQHYSDMYSSLPKIHTDATNRIFKNNKSPWEIILVRNYKNNPGKTLLIYRSHHTLGDTISCFKVLIEALGEKKLKLPEVKYAKQSILDKIMFYALVPFYFVYYQVCGYYIHIKADDCPLKFKGDVEPLLHIGISERISMKEIKEIAKNHNVTTSAVIMAGIAGGIAKIDPNLSKKEIPCQWVLPKPNHPDKLSNHSYCEAMNLPTHLADPKDRLRKCSEIFTEIKNSKLHHYSTFVLYQYGTWHNSLRRKLLKSSTFPLLLTNIASDVEGFSVGQREVEEFTMTCAPLRGSTGVSVCAFSYKDVIEISATAKSTILTEAQTQKLTDLMGNEFQVLKNI